MLVFSTTPYLTNLTSSKSSITQGISGIAAKTSAMFLSLPVKACSQEMSFLLPVSVDAAGSGLYMHPEDRKGRWLFTDQNFASKISWDT